MINYFKNHAIDPSLSVCFNDLQVRVGRDSPQLPLENQLCHPDISNMLLILVNWYGYDSTM